MKPSRCLVVATALLSLLGCSHFDKNGMPKDLKGTWSFYTPFLDNDSAHITFSNGTYKVSGRAEHDHGTTFNIEGTYTYDGKTLHVTFDQVSANLSAQVDKISKDLIEGDVNDLRSAKNLDFNVVPQGEGVLELVSHKEQGDSSGDVDFLMCWGSSPSTISTSMGWLNVSASSSPDESKTTTDPNFSPPPPPPVQPPVDNSQDQQQQPSQDQQTPPPDQGQQGETPPDQSSPPPNQATDSGSGQAPPG